MQKKPAVVVTPSAWLMRRVERSMLAEAAVESHVIPNGVDLSLFRPICCPWLQPTNGEGHHASLETSKIR